MSRKSINNVVYLLHFSKRMHHAQHYIGYTDNLDRRIKLHAAGRADCSITRAFKKAGISFVLSRVWLRADRKFERMLKNQKNTPRLCPICNKELRSAGSVKNLKKIKNNVCILDALYVYYICN